MRFWLLLGLAMVVTIAVFILVQFLLFTPKSPSVDIIPADAKTVSQPAPYTPLPLGRHFMIGHFASTPIASTTELLTKHQLAGVIIMSAPQNPTDIKNWTEAWQNAVDYPLIIAIDQEGGEVTRLKGETFTTTGQRDISGVKPAYTIGKQRGEELSALGITMNFAPVLDTATRPDSFLYNRVFATTPAELAHSLALGLLDSGITPVVKHFPGHPDTPQDSHHTLPTVGITKDEHADFIGPFATYLADTPGTALMTAHVAFPYIDNLPATLSPYWLKTVLRDELKYQGLIITDDMSMDAIDTTWTSAEASRLALTAGADIVLLAAVPSDVTNIIGTLASTTIDLKASDERIRNYVEATTR